MSDARTLRFAGLRGDRLEARLDLPDGAPRAVALFAHCFACSNDGFAAAQIARPLTEVGIAVLRFEFIGLGGPGGEPANTTFSSDVDDLVAAAGQLRSAVAAPSILIGHSLAGAAVLAAAARVPEGRAVVTLGAPAGPAHVADLLIPSRKHPGGDGHAWWRLAGRSFLIRQEFLDEIGAPAQCERIATLRRALLIMHSPRDEVVGVDNARVIFDAARHPKSFISLDGADHLLTRQADASYVGGVIAAWAIRYLPMPAAPHSGAAPAAASPPGVVVVAESGAGPYGQRITVNGHQLLADEPATIGGADTGPTPYDLLLAGLGACTSITVRMYAERKRWPLRHTTVRLRHRRIHAKDCAGCEIKTGRVDHIEREIQFDGELTGEQRATLLDIAERCPVHRTLHSEVLIVTTEAGSARSRRRSRDAPAEPPQT